MYKIIRIDKYIYETFFILKNEETGKEIECFEMLYYDGIKQFHFIKEGESYDCLISREVDVVEEKEHDYEKYYEILELNIRVGICKFAKLKLEGEIYYVKMEYLKGIKDLENRKTILLRGGYCHLLKVNDVINPVYYKTEEEIKQIPLLLEKAKKENDDFHIKYYTRILKDLED